MRNIQQLQTRIRILSLINLIFCVLNHLNKNVFLINVSRQCDAKWQVGMTNQLGICLVVKNN